MKTFILFAFTLFVSQSFFTQALLLTDSNGGEWTFPHCTSLNSPPHYNLQQPVSIPLHHALCRQEPNLNYSILVTKTGTCSDLTKLINAEKMLASALVIATHDENQNSFDYLSLIPIVMINSNDYQAILTLLSKNPNLIMSLDNQGVDQCQLTRQSLSTDRTRLIISSVFSSLIGIGVCLMLCGLVSRCLNQKKTRSTLNQISTQSNEVPPNITMSPDSQIQVQNVNSDPDQSEFKYNDTQVIEMPPLASDANLEIDADDKV